jgi:hypothetical protein
MIGILQYEGSLDTGFSLCLSGVMTAENVQDTLHYAARSNHDRQISDIERQAHQILVAFGHDPGRPGDIKAPAERPHDRNSTFSLASVCCLNMVGN